MYDFIFRKKREILCFYNNLFFNFSDYYYYYLLTVRNIKMKNLKNQTTYFVRRA